MRNSYESSTSHAHEDRSAASCDDVSQDDTNPFSSAVDAAPAAHPWAHEMSAAERYDAAAALWFAPLAYFSFQLQATQRLALVVRR